ncbi:zinc-dependent metalloprotease [Gardnerella vaginalis]|nr:zinc-dependent metalloprotease [Gardnerella vaginalis]RIY23425.1 hydrolase [Gardnerella vaginalis]
MSEEEIHQWLVDCFGSEQGEKAWHNFENLPFDIREHIKERCGIGGLPTPGEVHAMMQAFSTGGLNNPLEMRVTLEDGPINKKLAQSIAIQRSTSDGGTVNAEVADCARRALSQANLWLDTSCNLNPAPGTPDILSRSDWIEGTIDSWVKFANPVAKSVCEAFTSVISARFGDSQDTEVDGIYDGIMPIPMPDEVKQPDQFMRLLGNTSFAMQLGYAAGALSHEVHGSFDQGIALLNNPAGGLIPYNCIDYAKTWGLDVTEVMNYLALRELAHARLFASVPWLMPRFEALIIKYADGISIDLDAVEDQLRDIQEMDPEAVSGAVDISKVADTDTEGQKQALRGLETLLALTEGWVDCVIWRAGMAHIPHIDQLREMMRRERAAGGPSEITFESLIGLRLRPRRMREAAALWDSITNEKGIEERDSMWNHPDLLPDLPESQDEANASDKKTNTTDENSTDNNNKQIDSADSTNKDELSKSYEADSTDNEESSASKIDNDESEHENSYENKKNDNVETNAEINAESNSESETETNKESKESSMNMPNLEDFKNSEDLEKKLKDVNWDDELSKLLASNDTSDDESDDANNNADEDSDNGETDSDSNPDSDINK